VPAPAHLTASSHRSPGAHPGRLTPADATHASRASMECHAYVELMSAGRREHARDLDQIRCPVLLARPAKDRVLPFEQYGRPLSEALPEGGTKVADSLVCR
jgi:pimeloyl-ACP methyl ester carboxylesterase